MKSTASGKVVEMCWLAAKQAQITKKKKEEMQGKKKNSSDFRRFQVNGFSKLEN